MLSRESLTEHPEYHVFIAMKGPIDRRTFIRTTATAGIAMGVAGRSTFAGGISSPNQRITVAVMGVNSRGDELARSFASQTDVEVLYVCDVDSRAVEKTSGTVSEIQGTAPAGVTDFRRALEDADVDVLAIAAPDHWHAPATILGLDAGKHIYVEKPCGHNPHEGELLVEAQRKYNRVVQMGTQQRSGPSTIEAIDFIHQGGIGRPYMARTWYANKRGPIGSGKEVPVPDWLDYELWQGPAPRTPYRDNVIHYNWHWFHRWGTGESCNNGTHELDIARWALGVDYPERVQSSGGRYHFDDDWEFYDTQMISFDFADEKTITWEGRSCNPFQVVGRGRGTTVHGTEGTVIMDRNGYEVYDLDNVLLKEVKSGDDEATLDTRGGGNLTDRHIANFFDAIRNQADLNSPIDEGHKSVLMCHLGNIAQETGRTLHMDQGSGRIVGDPQAMQLWRREYEAGWEPTV
jgi:predicted dehydrogenase